MDMSVVFKVVLSVIFMISVLTGKVSSQNPQHGRCLEPEDFEQSKTDLHKLHDHESVLNTQPNSTNPHHLEYIRRRFVNITTTHEYGRTECPTERHHHTDQSTSTCPWYFVENTDENRYPRTIFHAVCSCSNCLDFHNDVQTTNTCQPVLNYIRVLRRKRCHRGRYEYETIKEPMPTGCTCTTTGQRPSHTGNSGLPSA